jgi:hypothetical protein
MLDLSVGGPSWTGFSFKKYSNAKEFRLFLPNGPKHFLVLSAQEIQENWRQAQYRPELISRINKLESQTNGAMARENHDLKIELSKLLKICDLKAPHFTENESRDIVNVLALLTREIKDPGRRLRPYTVVNNAPNKLTYR